METTTQSKTDVLLEKGQTHFNSESEKFLTFILEDEEYGIEILKVREIIGMVPITPIPQSPPQLKGITNLRGKVISVFDLRLMFGMEMREYDSATAIIIVDIKGHLTGVIVDTVSEVLDVKREDAETGSDLEKKINARFLLGIAKIKQKIRILIDIEKVLGDENVDSSLFCS